MNLLLLSVVTVAVYLLSQLKEFTWWIIPGLLVTHVCLFAYGVNLVNYTLTKFKHPGKSNVLYGYDARILVLVEQAELPSINKALYSRLFIGCITGYPAKAILPNTDVIYSGKLDGNKIKCTAKIMCVEVTPMQTFTYWLVLSPQLNNSPNDDTYRIVKNVKPEQLTLVEDLSNVSVPI